MRLKWAILAACSVALAGPGFTLQQIMGYAFPTDLVAAPHDGRVAWVLNERGARNVWIAEGPSWKARRITSFTADDGQEIDEIDWLPDAHGLVYVRGGDFDTHRDDPNPASLPDGVEQAIWLSRLNADPPRKLAEGNSPAVSPQGDRVAFLKADEVWAIGLAEGDKPVQLIKTKGKVSDLRWSPDGSRLAFVSARTDHSFVGLYDPASKSLKYLDPSVDRDTNPVWSPDGTLVAFVRIPANDRAFLFGPERSAQDPWSIRVASADTGAGRELWKAQPGPGSAFHGIVAANQLFWGAGDRMVFPWEKTGWVHLYSLSTRGGAPTDLGGAGEYEVEHVSLGWDRQSVLFASNLGDIDRRHISRVSVLGENRISVTGGSGIEWSPVELSDGHGIAVLRSDFKTPAHASVVEAPGKPAVDLAPETLPADFPAPDLVEPQPVLLTATDGLPIHGQLFLPRGLKPGERRPAVIFFHGGSRRQMLLGFHYMDYYHNAYAMNQYLANLGYIVLAVNYRSGIGYGLDFREALNYGATGASEFNDVLGAGLYLRNRSDVDGARIGLWGGSYGGYLTALGLARASNLFAAGVDFHGVHDWNNVIRNLVPEYDPNRDVNAARIAFESSPMASISTWKSPVLLIHGDDDRNVPFHESIMLAEALRKQGVPFEQLVFPDEIHGFLTWRRWVEAYGASAAFLGKYLKP
jgi:dipeptidyl aminopeptidase/acylaminoacyl peptidase